MGPTLTDRSGSSQDPARFFSSAELGLVSSDIAEAARRPLEGSWEDLVDEARHSVGGLLAPRNDSSYHYDPKKYISLFTNMTGAFCRVLSQIDKYFAGSLPTLLTTDLEYPGCVTAIDDSWRGPVVMAQIADALRTSRQSPTAVLHDTLSRAHNFVKPHVVFVSHVTRTTGQIISVKTLKYLREATPQVIIILDGSQAVGNIVVTEEVLEEVDFYIASGHKWLGGIPASGFVWEREPGRWNIADPAQSLIEGTGHLGGTGNAAAWVSLIMSTEQMTRDQSQSRLQTIAADNRKLGATFRDEVGMNGDMVEIITPQPQGGPPSGLVTIAVPKKLGKVLAERLGSAGYQFTVLKYERVRWSSPNRFLLACDPTFLAIRQTSHDTAIRPNTNLTEMRFCFHHFHVESHVRDLAHAITQCIDAVA